MDPRAERQKQQRSVDGSPAREAMLRWNKSPAAKEARMRYLASDKGRAMLRAKRAKGSRSYEARQVLRAEYRAAAARGRARWTDEEEQTLRDLVASEAPEKHIATTLGRSLSAIMHKKHKMGITKPSRPEVTTK
jgi:hypothetical protein